MKSLLLFLLVYSIYPVASAALSVPSENSSGSKYLSIISTEPEGLDFIIKYRVLEKRFEKIHIISSNDCINLKPGLLLLVSDMGPNKDAINTALSNARKTIPDSYLRECVVKPDSPLAYSLPFVDKSILNLPQTTMNWSFEDVASAVVSIDDGYAFYVRRLFNGNIDDEVEGRQAALSLFDKKTGQQQPVLSQCWDFAEALRFKQQLVFQCMTAMAGDHYIHTVYIFDLTRNKTIFEKQYCQKPVITGDGSVACYEESVNQFGELGLTKQTYRY